ncbi:MAG: hypothetical protein GVY22_02270 [Gammaproteobacteria bacterium]|jgi:hypothetical protein|nr:hypothetical protein [Gammaproteobacteria bacterium]
MIENIRLMLMILPAIIRAVKEIEDVLPETGLGAVKLRLVRESLEATVDGISDFWPMIQKVVALVVSVFNESGLFRKSVAPK